MKCCIFYNVDELSKFVKETHLYCFLSDILRYYERLSGDYKSPTIYGLDTNSYLISGTNKDICIVLNKKDLYEIKQKFPDCFTISFNCTSENFISVDDTDFVIDTMMGSIYPYFSEYGYDKFVELIKNNLYI